MTANNQTKSTSRRGFTIVELVIIIAVLSILVAILVPTFSSVSNKARQNALRMDIGTAYTTFKADCGFREEVCLDIESYIFVPQSALAPDGDEYDATSLIFTNNGYKWNGRDSADVVTLTAAQLTNLYDTKAVMYGPFNNYYLIALNQAYLWEGNGTKASPYLIQSYRDLRSVSEHTARGESFWDKYFLLTTDLSITQDSWLPIGGFLSPSQEHGLNPVDFQGTFDGGGHTISLSYGQVSRASYCLFGSIHGATICNLKTVGTVDIVNFYSAGMIARADSSTIYNCENAVNVIGDHLVGGIVAYAFNCNIYNCINTGDILCYGTIDEGYAGGIVGNMGYYSQCSIENCRNEGNITGYCSIIGGITGNAWGTVRNCVNTGSVTSRNANFVSDTGIGSGTNDIFVGGIAGFGGGDHDNMANGKATFVGCLNTGTVTGSGYSVGGITGANAESITNCANTGNIIADGYVGGIAGVINNSACIVANVMNSGNIYAKGSGGPVGGIIGHLAFSNNWTLTLAVSGGEVHYRKGDSVTAYNDLGMFVGSAGGKVTLKNAYLAISAGATIGTKSGITQNMGKSITVSGTPTTQTNQSNLCSAVNSVISSSYSGKNYNSWALKTGYLNGYAVPTYTYHITFDIHKNLPTDQQVGFRLNTSFVGASTMYLPTLERSIVVTDGWQYTFKHWTVGSSNYAPGAKISLTGDTVVTAVWEKQAHTMTPLPFG